MIQIWKKKPVQVEAIKWTGDNFKSIEEWAGDNVAFLGNNELCIVTLEDGNTVKAKHVATIGDYIIKGVHGEFYFCKPDIFLETYDYVKDLALK